MTIKERLKRANTDDDKNVLHLAIVGLKIFTVYLIADLDNRISVFHVCLLI